MGEEDVVHVYIRWPSPGSPDCLPCPEPSPSAPCSPCAAPAPRRAASTRAVPCRAEHDPAAPGLGEDAPAGLTPSVLITLSPGLS